MWKRAENTVSPTHGEIGNAPAKNRTWTCSSGGCRDIHFTTGARRTKPNTPSRPPSRRSQQGPQHFDHLFVDLAVRGQDLIAEDVEAPAREVARPPSGLFDDEGSGRGIPGLELPFPEPVDAARSDPSEVEGGRSGAAYPLCAHHESLEEREVVVRVLPAVVGEAAGEERRIEVRGRRDP